MIYVLLLAGAVFLFMLVYAASRARADRLEREVAGLRKRLDMLEQRIRAVDATDVPAAPPAPSSVIAASVEEIPAMPVTSAIPAAQEATPVAPAPAPRSARDVEQLVGGVWLQNVGAVLLLAGFFFLILWGYATGRFGPGVLVAAGVLAGLGLVWRGSRMRHTVRGVGHALVGVGAGVVWLALYVGHFRLGVLPMPVAFGAVLAASLMTVVLGLRFRAQDVAIFGVIGAHLPNVLEALIPLYGFDLPPAMLLGWLAALNAVVFALAARAAWTPLALASLLMTAVGWIGAVEARDWSWPIEIGLAALFGVLGLSPLPALARRDAPLRAVDLALVAAAPLAFLATSAPMFELANPREVAVLLFTLAALHLLAALWVDARRETRDLWRPLVGAAVLFVTVAIERALGPDRTALAWTIEGVVLLLLGLGPRGGWLRACGYAVAALGGVALLFGFAREVPVGAYPLANAVSLPALIAIAALLFAVHRLRRARETFGALERVAADLGFLGAHLLLMIWSAREAHVLARAFEMDGGPWRGARDVRAPSSSRRYLDLFVHVMALAWFAQAAWLGFSGARAGRVLERSGALIVAAIAGIPFLVAGFAHDSWAPDLAPLIHRNALIALGSLVLVIAVAARLAAARGGLHRIERYTPQLWAAGAAFMLAVWIWRESGHLATVFQGPAGTASGSRALAGAITSVGWLLEAVAAFVLGWRRRSAFLRWTGIVLIGLTVAKFLIVDLASADPFWRFLTAIGAGAAMLVLSYVYQRAGKAKRADAA